MTVGQAALAGGREQGTCRHNPHCSTGIVGSCYVKNLAVATLPQSSILSCFTQLRILYPFWTSAGDRKIRFNAHLLRSGVHRDGELYLCCGWLLLRTSAAALQSCSVEGAERHIGANKCCKYAV